MRRTHLYLTLSIVSMMVAFGLGVAQKQCRYSKCEVKPELVKPEPVSVEPVWSALYARDFDRMAAEAILLTDSEYPGEGLRLRAYALRGQGRYNEADAAYTEALAKSRATIEKCDCYIGRALCRSMLGQKVAAQDDIARAKQLAMAQVKRKESTDHLYQFACVLAVESTMLEGLRAEEARLAAIGKFQSAISAGFNNWEHARADLDLDALRGDHRFQELFPKL